MTLTHSPLWRRCLAQCLAVLLLVCALMPWLSTVSASESMVDDAASMVHCSTPDTDSNPQHCGTTSVCEVEPVTAATPCSPDFVVAWLCCLVSLEPRSGTLAIGARETADPPFLLPLRVHAHVERWLI